MRASLIVPDREKRYLLIERVRAKWQENNTRAFVLEFQYESLNERDTAVLANDAEAGCDPVAIAPNFEYAAPELLAFIADDVFRGDTGGVNDAFE